MPDGSNLVIGQPTPRIDGRAKVTGRALYPSDEPAANPAHAYLVTSRIAAGSITGFDLAAARAVPGVLDILTHENVGGEADPPPPHGAGGETTTMQGPRIWHAGQIIAVVVADSFEAAREGAQALQVAYAEDAPSASFGSPGLVEQPRQAGEHEDFDVGDAEGVFARASVKVDAEYATPTQHHNPIELFTTTCVWNGPQLTIHEPSQFVYGLRGAVAKQLRMDPQDVRVVSRFIGGAFGSKGIPSARTAWIAIAARRLGRPVKLVATRAQGFTIATYRAETRHRVRLAAGPDGRFTALIHDGRELSSRPSGYNVSGTETTARVYACPNIRTSVSVAHADRNTPGFMRAPPDMPYMFALESAVDELAVALAMDPVELRRLNDTKADPVSDRHYSSRSLMQCFDQAAGRFGWSRRNPQPGTMRAGDWLVGLGCATAAYPANIGAGAARVTLGPDGRAGVQIAAHDIGTGSYTLIAMVAADRFGLPVEQVSVRLGDTDLPPAGLAAGSSHASGIAHAVAKACDDILARLAHAAVTANEGPFAGLDPKTLFMAGGMLRSPAGAAQTLGDALARVTHGGLEAYAENLPVGVPPDGVGKLYQGQMAISRGEKREDVTAYSFGAQFAEVHVHARTREIRVRRAVGAFANGRIINPTTAHSQLMGGMIWGIGSALHEATEIDARHARYTNDNLAEYLIPVNADAVEIEAIMVPEEDSLVNPLGMKGLGEVGIVGMAAAIANAVYNATGRRCRSLPIRLEHLL